MRASFVALLIATTAFGQSGREDWRSYGRNYAGWRYSELAEINTANVAQLRPQWIFQTGVNGKQETTPLVFNQMMYITAPANHAYALDGATGRPVWHYQKQVPPGVNVCCGQVNRGFAVIGDKLFKVNLEATLVALDSKTGRRLWETTIDDIKKGFSATVAPLAVKNLVIVGIAGAEFGTRGFIDAYDATTGKRVWRFYTVAAPGDPGGGTWGGNSWERGGGSTWITGTYDPELNITYWGTGNPGPDFFGDERPGDNLYTCSLVALDADTGKLKWHYQFTPHDVHDLGRCRRSRTYGSGYRRKEGEGGCASQSKWIFLRARSHERKIHHCEIVHAGELGRWHRRRWKAQGDRQSGPHRRR